MSLHFLISHLYHQIPSIWLQERVTGSPASVCCAAFCASTKSSPGLGVGPRFDFYRFCRKRSSDMTCTAYPNLHCFSLAFAWLKMHLKTNHFKKFTPFSHHSKMPLHLRLMFYHSRSDFSFLCQVLCLCPQRPRVQQNSVSFNARVNHATSQKTRWRFGLLERLL